MPVHAHGVGLALADQGNSITPVSSVWAQTAAGRGAAALYKDGAPNGQVNPQSLNITGGGLPHNNMQPYLTLNFCIALQGIFPQRP
jgi:microcystin-dependent protein